MKEYFIMNLAENITIVVILAVVVGLTIGWYLTMSYYESHSVPGGFIVEPSEPSPVPPPKRYRRLWKFVNVNNAGDNHTLNRSVLSLTSQGYEFQPEASHADYLAFMKLVEETEETEPNKIMNYNI